MFKDHQNDQRETGINRRWWDTTQSQINTVVLVLGIGGVS